MGSGALSKASPDQRYEPSQIKDAEITRLQEVERQLKEELKRVERQLREEKLERFQDRQETAEKIHESERKMQEEATKKGYELHSEILRLKKEAEKCHEKDREIARLQGEVAKKHVADPQLVVPEKDMRPSVDIAQEFLSVTAPAALEFVEVARKHNIRNTEAISKTIEETRAESSSVIQNVDLYESLAKQQWQQLDAKVKEARLEIDEQWQQLDAKVKEARLEISELEEQMSEQRRAQADKIQLQMSELGQLFSLGTWLREKLIALTTFSFRMVRADKLRAWSGGPLPHHQEIASSLGAESLQVVSVSLQDLFSRSAKMKTILVVSHRWVRPGCPDPDGRQQDTIIEHLKNHPEIEFVWQDWWCIAQGRRSRQEQDYFDKTLENIYMLYLGAQVLVLLDMAYLSRFWTSYEAWLSMRCVSQIGFSPAVGPDCRFNIQCLGAARAMEQSLKDTWQHLSIKQAYEALSEEDIVVTNRRDKEQQLQVLTKLEHDMPALAQLLLDLDNFEKSTKTTKTTNVWSTGYAFLAKLGSGKAVAWGNPHDGGDLAKVQAVLDTDGLHQVWSTRGAFLAKLKSGKAVAWGRLDEGGDLRKVQALLDKDGLDQVWSTHNVFLAKLKSGKAVAWGGSWQYCTGLQPRELGAVPAMFDTDGLDQVWSTHDAFLAKLKSGKAVVWGQSGWGEDRFGSFRSKGWHDTDGSKLQALLDTDGLDRVWSTHTAFLAKLKSGKAVACGSRGGGGDLGSSGELQALLDTDGLDQVWSTHDAFLAKLRSGKAVSWGCIPPHSYGEEGSGSGAPGFGKVQALLDTDGLDQVWSTRAAFLAKLKSGKAVAWGRKSEGGDLGEVQGLLDTDGLDQVWSTHTAFLAKLKSGKAVAWGKLDEGGDLAKVQALLDTDGLDQVWSTHTAFLAKLKSGKAVAWGAPGGGGELDKVRRLLETDSL